MFANNPSDLTSNAVISPRVTGLSDLYGEKIYEWSLSERERLAIVYEGFAKRLASLQSDSIADPVREKPA